MAYKALNFVIIVNRKSKRGGLRKFTAIKRQVTQT